jgi:hypothetical protein
MAKTYTAAGTVVAGDVYTAAAHNIIATDVNNLIVPPSVGVRLTPSDKTVTSGTAFAWDAQEWDTDDMWASGANITINTSGIYQISYTGRALGTSGFTYVLPEIKMSGQEGRIGAAGAVSTTDYRWFLSTTAVLEQGTTVSFAILFAGGGTVTVNGTDTAGSRNRASVSWIGRTS